MKWVEQDKYHISSGSWTIAKYYSPNGVKYGRSKMNKNLGYYDTLEKAKQNAQGFHFLAVQTTPEDESFAGFWMLKEAI